MFGFLLIVSAISALSPSNAEIWATGHLVGAACFLSQGHRVGSCHFEVVTHSLWSVVSTDTSQQQGHKMSHNVGTRLLSGFLVSFASEVVEWNCWMKQQSNTQKQGHLQLSKLAVWVLCMGHRA